MEERLKELAIKLFPSANAWAVKEGVKNVCAFLSEVNPGEYQQLHRAIFDRDAAIKEYDGMMRLEDRLERLAFRLNDDGQYTNANICWLALAELQSRKISDQFAQSIDCDHERRG